MHKFWGKIRQYKQRGRKLGFPTANINLYKNIPQGVYLSQVKLGNALLPALTFIGQAKTFNEKKHHAESYVLNFKQNIYGRWISVILLKKIRGNKKFASSVELIEQMKKDEQQARKYFEINT